MRRPCQLSGAIAKALMTRALSMSEIASAVGLKAKHTDSIGAYVFEWHDVGLIYVCGWTYRLTPIYRWQPSPFEIDDEPKPMTKVAQQRQRGAAIRAEREQLRQTA